MTEAEIQREIVEALRLAGFLVFRMNSGRVMKNLTLCPEGTPDLLAV